MRLLSDKSFFFHDCDDGRGRHVEDDFNDAIVVVITVYELFV